MNDELNELEFIEARVEAALENRRKPGFALMRGVAAAGFAAAVAWLVAFSPGMAEPRGAALEPVVAEETLQSAQDEGLMTLDDGSLARRMRLRYVETVSWSGGGRTLTWTAPREELRIMPVMTY